MQYTYHYRPTAACSLKLFFHDQVIHHFGLRDSFARPSFLLCPTDCLPQSPSNPLFIPSSSLCRKTWQRPKLLRNHPTSKLLSIRPATANTTLDGSGAAVLLINVISVSGCNVQWSPGLTPTLSSSISTEQIEGGGLTSQADDQAQSLPCRPM